jgi:hypothetical protein
MKSARLYIIVLVGVLIAGCARHAGTTKREDQAAVDGCSNIGTLPNRSLLETGRRYFAQVKREATDGHASWRVQNSPIPRHYAVEFEWLNLSNLNTPREGIWTFVIKDVERWHDSGRGGPMGLFVATYKCDVLRIEDAPK